MTCALPVIAGISFSGPLTIMFASTSPRGLIFAKESFIAKGSFFRSSSSRLISAEICASAVFLISLICPFALSLILL